MRNRDINLKPVDQDFQQKGLQEMYRPEKGLPRRLILFLNLRHYTTPLVYFWNLGTEDKEG